MPGASGPVLSRSARSRAAPPTAQRRGCPARPRRAASLAAWRVAGRWPAGNAATTGGRPKCGAPLTPPTRVVGRLPPAGHPRSHQIREACQADVAWVKSVPTPRFPTPRNHLKPNQFRVASAAVLLETLETSIRLRRRLTHAPDWGRVEKRSHAGSPRCLRRGV